jgi:hypothetical protein
MNLMPSQANGLVEARSKRVRGSTGLRPAHHEED